MLKSVSRVSVPTNSFYERGTSVDYKEWLRELMKLQQSKLMIRANKSQNSVSLCSYSYTYPSFASSTPPDLVEIYS